MKSPGGVQSALFLTIVFIGLSGAKVLDDYIRHYDTVNYDRHDLHSRHKRSTSNVLHLDINGFGRTFRLKLKKDSSIYPKGFKLEFDNVPMETDLSILYKGTVEGHPGSRVDGAIIQGIFRGTIHLPGEDESYHVEKSGKFFDTDQGFHSVIYKESDIDMDPYRERRERERREAGIEALGSCGNDQSHKWMQSVVNSEIKTDRKKRSEEEWQEVNTGSHNIYSETSNMEKPARKKRATLGKRNTCYMFLRSDPIFWDHYVSKSGGDTDVAKDEILAFFTSHINAINSIYEFTTFDTYDDSMSYAGVQFAVGRTLVMTRTGSCEGSKISAFCSNNIDVSNFLNLNSMENHDEYCLAYIFTYRDFSQGTLGLAWVGSPSPASGGICERMKGYSENGRSVAKSLNTGIVTVINYGREVAFRVSQLTFAHEVGHNFGSPHDSGPNCTPYGTNRGDASQGNYIMFASATMGDKPHNNKFSVCSKDNITRVIEAILTSTSKTNCFKESGLAFCGNGLVEEGEECDCGYKDDCDDNCCNAKNANPSNPSLDCTLKTGANIDCSPSQGPCCTDQCRFISQGANQTCRYKTECSKAAYCSGTKATCPASAKEDDGTYCNNYGFICVNGECAGSLCEKFGWTECFLTGQTKTKEDQERLCKLACVENGTQDCVLSSDSSKLSLPLNGRYADMVSEVIQGRGKGQTAADGIKLAAGSPCNNFQGYCDVFHRCRGVDAEGPLARLKKLIFSEETLKTIGNWIVEHWWAVLLMGIGLILAMGLFIKFCAVHTPSSNPKAKPARKLSETMTLRRRRNQQRAQQQPQQVRYPQNQELLVDAKYPAKNPQGPPPPYPGSSGAPSGGPPHGHGKKGRKGKDIEMGRI